MCRNFKWHEPEHILFSLKITGKVLKDRIISEVVEDVQEALFAAYGRESATRRGVVRLHEIYEIIQSTGHFAKDIGRLANDAIKHPHITGIQEQFLIKHLFSSPFFLPPAAAACLRARSRSLVRSVACLFPDPKRKSRQ